MHNLGVASIGHVAHLRPGEPLLDISEVLSPARIAWQLIPCRGADQILRLAGPGSPIPWNSIGLAFQLGFRFLQL